MYEVHFPITPLRLFIECFWFLQTEVTPPARLEELIFTDGRADIVFNLGAAYLRRQANQPNQTQLMRLSNLDAQRRYPVHIIQQGRIDLIGVRFRPGGLAAFLPMPVSELDGLTLALPDAFGLPGDDLESQLFETAGQRPRQLSLLNDFFRRRLEVPAAHRWVTHLAAAIEQSQGQIKMGNLSREYGYSIRTLDRLFQQVMGLSPKFYARIVRFRHTLNCLVQQPAIEWVELVTSGGYYDQPHLVKEFVAFTGVSPEVYRARLHSAGVPAAPNYVQFLQDD
ncbi:MAG: helix-turn-helix domain-containing protein [Chloroflexota bacterium]